MCACGAEVESTEHFLLRCHFYNTQRLEHFENLKKVAPNILSFSAKKQLYILLYSSQTNSSKSLNHEIFKNVISCIIATTLFNGPLIFNQ